MIFVFVAINVGKGYSVVGGTKDPHEISGVLLPIG
jgi:hypothetical protein